MKIKHKIILIVAILVIIGILLSWFVFANVLSKEVDKLNLNISNNITTSENNNTNIDSNKTMITNNINVSNSNVSIISNISNITKVYKHLSSGGGSSGGGGGCGSSSQVSPIIIPITSNSSQNESNLSFNDNSTYFDNLTNITYTNVSYVNKSGIMCVQLIQPANNTATGECKEFPTPCDVPDNWTIVPACPKKIKVNISTGIV